MSTNTKATDNLSLSLDQRPLVHSSNLVETDLWLRRGVWLYFILLIMEGALRKWFLPGLATPLLIVRDPIALWLVLSVWQRGQLPLTAYVAGCVGIGVVGIFTAVFLGHGSIPVALFGARILLIHFPLMFVIGRIFTQADVIKLGRVTLMIAIPMAILTAMQFYSPQSAWVNRGLGGSEEGAGFSGAMGYFRPPGTFSFTNGLSLFFSFVAPFVFYFWIRSEKISKFILIGGTLALLASIPLSISRSLLFSVLVTMLFTVIGVAFKPKFLGRIIVACIGLIIALAALSQTSFFQTAFEAFTSRFETANSVEGGVEGVLVDRYLGGLIGQITGNADIPLFGYGIGMGTNVGSMLLAGKVKYLIAEGEWGRLIGELGLLMGMGMILLRLGFCAKVTWAAYTKLRSGDLLPWVLLSFGLLVIPQSQWAQPTALGFSTLIGGLIIASMRGTECSGDNEV
ncbi:hypothetical protein [Pontibacter sp. H249]|uniref:hypothetical protein n=1 Tax=Pontibacter sp. H249 TaxID=3133420 RepID=UPI0030BAE5FD